MNNIFSIIGIIVFSCVVGCLLGFTVVCVGKFIVFCCEKFSEWRLSRNVAYLMTKDISITDGEINKKFREKGLRIRAGWTKDTVYYEIYSGLTDVTIRGFYPILHKDNKENWKESFYKYFNDLADGLEVVDDGVLVTDKQRYFWR